MSKSKKKAWSLLKAAAFGCLVVALLLPVSAQAMSAGVTGAKTSPPPGNIVVYSSTFDPNHKYLSDGVTVLSNGGKGTASVTGKTTSAQEVDTIGVKWKLEQWTGSSWVEVASTPDYTASNKTLVAATSSSNVSTGYYYRVTSTHWVIKNGVREQGTRTSDSYLIK